MAELISGRMQPRVDLTPMVDLAFLLITFFMLTTSLQKQHALDISMPDKTHLSETINFADKRTMTILLGNDHRVAWYWGLMEAPIEGPKMAEFGKSGIKTVLQDKIIKVIQQQSTGSKPLMVIIRPSNQSSYGDLVNILDEMRINGIIQYAIDDIGRAEIQLLTKLGLYK
ncbi:biopolymer transporter ExbD [Olivibacter sp. CPCC 100613]|uniref:ExbD/TolR family protein n=1 Tax=Olivibacter sp. CPCC 100613 TaxID=3079931 RepID=UPI002FFC3A33